MPKVVLITCNTATHAVIISDSQLLKLWSWQLAWKVEWLVGRDGEHIFIFSGGLPQVQPSSSRIPLLVILDQSSPINPLLQPLPRTSQERSPAWRCSRGSTPQCWRWSSASSTSVSSPTPSTDLTMRTRSPSWCYSQMIWWEGMARQLDMFGQVAIDCKSTGLPSHENPYAMDFQVHHPPSSNLLEPLSL